MNKHLSEPQLFTLIFDDEDSQSSRQLARHVENCSECQTRMSTFVGNEDERTAAIQYLKDAKHSNSLPELEEGTSIRNKPRLDFLGKPSHPEMLGRLGRYEIESVIGSGGMGIVLKAFDSELNRPVAIKVLARHLAESGAARKRFAREARAAAAVVHDNVVAIHNVETDGDVPFLVMQYVTGESLQTRVDRDGPLSEREILRVAAQTAAGLAAAHEQGIIHRDIKPANILLENNVERVYITDFGLARTVDDASLTQTGIVAGTPHYMSPEQANGELTDQRSDLFSLGSLMYYMATGEPPFRAERAMGVLHRICSDKHLPAWRHNPDISDALSNLIDRLLEKKPTNRLRSSQQLHRQLTLLLNQSQHRSAKPLQSLRRLAVRNRNWLCALAVTSVIVACVIVGLMALPQHSTKDVSRTSAADSTDHPTETVDSDSENKLPDTEIGAFTPVEITQLLDDVKLLETSNGNGGYLGVDDSEWAEQADEINRRLEDLERGSTNNPF